MSFSCALIFKPKALSYVINIKVILAKVPVLEAAGLIPTSGQIFVWPTVICSVSGCLSMSFVHLMTHKIYIFFFLMSEHDERETFSVWRRLWQKDW